MEFVTDILNNWTTYTVSILAVLGGLNVVASTIVKLTPSLEDDAALDKVVTFIERFSFILKKPSKPTE